MRAPLLFVVVALLTFAMLLVGRAVFLVPAPSELATRLPAPTTEPALARARAERLAGAIRFPTVSHQDPEEFDPRAFADLRRYLEQTFPHVHAQLEHERVAGHSLLFRWPGSDPSRRPYLLMAHQDVVPVIPGTETDWDEPPFGGVISGGYIWGRGALDDKFGVVAILDAVESLLAEGFQPSRDVYLAFGHDEELGGVEGATAIAQLLADRGVALEYVLDEGGAVIDGWIPGLDRQVALIGIAEKGYLNLELTVRAAGGHSSAPPPSTAIGILSRAVNRLEAHPFPIDPAYLGMTFREYLAPYMPFEMRILASNLWLFAPLLASSPQLNAMLRTTTAVTMFNAGVKANVLPIEATAVVNFRILPGETIDSVTEHVIGIIDDPRVSVAALGASAGNPSPVSDTTSASFATLVRTVHQTLGDDVIVAPYLVFGGTDSKHFAELTHNVYRFNPFVAEADLLERFHGTNERIGVNVYAGVVSFYARLIRASDQM